MGLRGSGLSRLVGELGLVDRHRPHWGGDGLYGSCGDDLGQKAEVAHHVSPVGSVDDGLEVRLDVMTLQILSCGLICLDLNLVAGREEGVEPNYQLRMAFEQHGHSGYDARSINRLRFELLKVQS